MNATIDIQVDLGVVFGVPSSPRPDLGVAAALFGVCLPADQTNS